MLFAFQLLTLNTRTQKAFCMLRLGTQRRLCLTQSDALPGRRREGWATLLAAGCMQPSSLLHKDSENILHLAFKPERRLCLVPPEALHHPNLSSVHQLRYIHHPDALQEKKMPHAGTVVAFHAVFSNLQSCFKIVGPGVHAFT